MSVRTKHSVDPIRGIYGREDLPIGTVFTVKLEHLEGLEFTVAPEMAGCYGCDLMNECMSGGNNRRADRKEYLPKCAFYNRSDYRNVIVVRRDPH